MTLVNQDLILEYARNMGEFTAKQMASVVYGDIGHSHITAANKKLIKLAKRGDVIRVGRRKIGGEQPQMFWRAVL